jgi:osomolarity two-component system phosphorelay intermediate protein YPD1
MANSVATDEVPAPAGASTGGVASTNAASTMPPEDVIDWSTFSQILEMDEDDQEFSKSIVQNYFDQAESTFSQMEAAFVAGNLEELSSLGHFLKGSSAALGLTKVKDSCEKIQHLGSRKDETGSVEVNDDALCLDRIRTTLDDVRNQYSEIQEYLRSYFGGSL